MYDKRIVFYVYKNLRALVHSLEIMDWDPQGTNAHCLKEWNFVVFEKLLLIMLSSDTLANDVWVDSIILYILYCNMQV